MSLLLEKPVPDLLQSSVNDMRDQLQHLVPIDFLIVTPPRWLGHVPRYLKGIEARHAKLLDAGLDRDSRGASAVWPFWRAYLDRLAAVPERGPLPVPWVEFRWLIEEYRVSLFAQQLGTATKVSEKVLKGLARPIATVIFGWWAKAHPTATLHHHAAAVAAGRRRSRRPSRRSAPPRPTGVTAPSHRWPLRTRAYNVPAKISVPTRKHHPATLPARPSRGPAAARASSARAWVNVVTRRRLPDRQQVR